MLSLGVECIHVGDQNRKKPPLCIVICELPKFDPNTGVILNVGLKHHTRSSLIFGP